MANQSTSTQLNRRERLREATLIEIRAAARQLLVTKGSGAVTVNAVARRIGMTGPAIYRYYASLAELMEALREDLFKELIGCMRAAAAAGNASTPGLRLLAISRALRGWAISHPAEFRLLFASPATGPHEARCETGRAFGQVFLEQVVELWQTQRFPIRNLDDVAPSMADQLLAYSDKIGGVLPAEAAYIFLNCWTRLYGLLCMEVLDQMSFAYSDFEPVFEECLQELCGWLDIPYLPPDHSA